MSNKSSESQTKLHPEARRVITDYEFYYYWGMVISAVLAMGFTLPLIYFLWLELFNPAESVMTDILIFMLVFILPGFFWYAAAYTRRQRNHFGDILNNDTMQVISGMVVDVTSRKKNMAYTLKDRRVVCKVAFPRFKSFRGAHINLFTWQTDNPEITLHLVPARPAASGLLANPPWAKDPANLLVGFLIRTFCHQESRRRL